MRIIVWGLGYVGTVSAACLAQLGHEVIGVEPNLTKVEALNAGHCAIKEPGLDHVVVLRSTVFPGTMRKVLGPLVEEHSGRQAGRDFGLVAHPEFMRETNAISDFYAPPYTVIGELDTRSGDQLEALYRDLQAPIYRVSLEKAEFLKLANNAFHALKIGFANEIGRLCDRLGVDSHAIMRLVCADTKL